MNKTLKVGTLGMIFLLLAASCGELSKRAEDKLNQLEQKTNELDSLVNKEVDKVKALDTLINLENKKVQKLDSLINKSSSKMDSLLENKKKKLQNIIK